MQNKFADLLNGSSLSFRRVLRIALRREISMMEWTKKSRFLDTLGMTIVGLFLSSCSSSIPLSKPAAQPFKKNTPDAVVVKQFLPEGWADITSKSKQPQIKYWLVNRNNSATMVLRQIQTDSASQKSLMNEDLNVVTNISLLSKLPENNSGYRVTRVPKVIDTKRNFFSYAYTENGLLRRVIIFTKQQKLFELELMQERSSSEFDELTNDLVTFAITLYDRRE